MERFGRRGPSRSQGQTLDDPPSFRCDSNTSWCGPAQWASHTAIRPNHRITALGNRRDEGGAQSNRLTIDKFRGIRLARADRKSAVKGKWVYVGVDLGVAMTI